MFISRRRFELELQKAKDETAERFYAENNQREMEARMERRIDALNSCLDDRFKDTWKEVKVLTDKFVVLMKKLDALEDKTNDRFIAEERALGAIKMEIAAVREKKE